MVVWPQCAMSAGGPLILSPAFFSLSSQRFSGRFAFGIFISSIGKMFDESLLFLANASFVISYLVDQVTDCSPSFTI